MLRHHVLRRLARQFPIVWIEPAHNWRDYLLPSGDRFMAADRWSEPFPGLDIFTPGWRNPLVHRPSWLRTAALASRLAAARRRLLDRGAQRILLYVWRDEFAEALDCVRHDISCYHIDDEYSFSERDVPNSARETRLIQRVDQVIVHSLALMRKKGGVNPRIALVPNGVDFRSFARPHEEPADLAVVPRPRIGYAGVIKKQLDLALLVRLALARPQHSFVLVGPVLNVSGKEEHVARLRQSPNVFFLGAKPAEVLPAYVQHFDVCLMCYEVNDYTNYIYPLKLNEYLATGRPTVSSPIDAVRSFSEVVTIASTHAEWLEAIDAGLGVAANTPATVEFRQAYAHEHDWDALVERIAGLFHDALARADSTRGQPGRAESVTQEKQTRTPR